MYKLVRMLVCKSLPSYCVLRGSETNRILRTVDVIGMLIGMLGMLQVGFVASYYAESVFIELITGKLIRFGMSQNDT